MNKNLIGMFVFLVIGLGLGLLAGGRPLGRDGADAAPTTASKRSLPPPGSGQLLAEMHQQKTRMMVEALKISEAEKKAIDEAVASKFAAREQLQSQSLRLFQVAIDLRATDDELGHAVEAYAVAKDRFQLRIREIDEELVKRISVRTRAKIITTGTLDNGLGFMAGSRSMPMPGMQEIPAMQAMAGMQAMGGRQAKPGIKASSEKRTGSK
jgi:hypothetical protein